MKRATHIDVPQHQLRRAKSMRGAMTEAERRLRRGLRCRLGLQGTHFRRQVPIAGFITDFRCHSLRLVIEVDGNQHGTDEALAFDARRTCLIEADGYKVLLFSNYDVLRSLDTIAAAAAFPVGEEIATHG